MGRRSKWSNGIGSSSISTRRVQQKKIIEQSVTERVNKQIYRRHLAFLCAQVINIFAIQCTSGHMAIVWWWLFLCVVERSTADVKRSGSWWRVFSVCVPLPIPTLSFCSGCHWNEENIKRKGSGAKNLNEIHVFCLPFFDCRIFQFRYRVARPELFCYHLSLICSRCLVFPRSLGAFETIFPYQALTRIHVHPICASQKSTHTCLRRIPCSYSIFIKRDGVYT